MGEVCAGCLRTPGTSCVLATRQASVPRLVTPAATLETGIKAPVGVGANRVAQRSRRGKGQLKIPPETQWSSLKTQSEALHLAGLLTDPVAEGLAHMGKRWELRSLWWGEKKNQLGVMVPGCEMAVHGLGGWFLCRGYGAVQGHEVP